MKPAAVSVFLLSTFLFLSTFAAAAFAPVRDTDGKTLTRGTGYYILPSPGVGGGLTLGSRRNPTCPLYVAKESSSHGFPVAFLPYTNDSTVRVMTDANFQFSSASTICVEPTVWKLGAPDVGTGRIYVATGGFVGRTGPDARDTWFRIETFEEGAAGAPYKLVYCPQPPVCRNCGKPRCGDLGLFEEHGKVWLGFSGSSFPAGNATIVANAVV